MISDPAQWLKAVRDAINSTKTWVFGLLVSGITLALPDRFASALGIQVLRNGLRPWLGAAFLLSVAGLITGVGSSALSWLKAKKAATMARAQLQSLSPVEKSLLVGYLKRATNTLYFPLENGVVAGLVARRILFRPTNTFNLVRGCAFNLSPWAREELETHPELLQVTEEEASALGDPDEIQDLLDADIRRRRYRF